MNFHPPLILYFTIGCHLCEQAEVLLFEAQLPFKAIDIAEDMALMERYGLRIPVLQRKDTAVELSWPFDAATLAQFIV